METVHKQAIRKVLLASMVCAFGGFGAGAYAAQGYVTDNTGNVVHDNSGHCVRTQSWVPQDATRQCDADIFAAFEKKPTQPQMQRITLDADTTFGFDEAQLTEQGKQDLDRIVQAAKRSENPTVHIAGYTDRIGPESYNEELSKRRADAVRQYLVEHGIPENAIQVSALGEQNPVVSCTGMRGHPLVECLRPNRRSEVEFSAFEPVQQSQQTGGAME